MKNYLPVLFMLLLFARCAQQVAPTGGKKDTTAPSLLKSDPPNRTLNFRGSEITLTFDEYVKIDNIQQKLSITPETDNPYTAKQKAESVTLAFKDKFADSTTFTFNFGDGIKDFAEGNPVQNLKLVFSTGPSIDSGRVYGSIADLRTNKPVFDALVGLYKLKDTLNPEKQKPYYFSRTDSSGVFSIENVQTDRYQLFAFDDKNRNQLYNSKEERLAFISTTTQIGTDSLSYTLMLALSDNTLPRVQRTLPKVNDYSIVFNKGIDSVAVLFSDADTLAFQLENATQLKFFKGASTADSLIVDIVAIDSLGQRLEQKQKIAFLTQRSKTRQLDPLTLVSLPGPGKPLARDYKVTFVFNKPIARLQADRISQQNDSLNTVKLSTINTQWNRYRNTLTVEGLATARDTITWRFEKGAVISIEGDTLSATVYKYPVLNEEDYGVIRGNIKADPGMSIIIELIDEEFKTIRTAYGTPYEFTRIPPGLYDIRVIIDRNKNRRWDTGWFRQGRQSEMIYYYPKPITVKANFELDDLDFSIPSNSTD